MISPSHIDRALWALHYLGHKVTMRDGKTAGAAPAPASVATTLQFLVANGFHMAAAALEQDDGGNPVQGEHSDQPIAF